MKYTLIAVSAFLLFSTCRVTAETRWKIDKPYLNNPLTTATIEGVGEYRGISGKVWLTLSCRKDAPPVRVTLQAENTLATQFPVRVFEGPGAAGEKARLVSARVGKQTLQRAWHSSGWFQEHNVFAWSFALQEAELKRWINAKDSSLTLYVEVPAKEVTRLTAVFTLPPVTGPLRQVAVPCMQ